MGQDYNARKNAKKQWKKHAKQHNPAETEAGGLKRIRKKKNVRRRLCQGMCYLEPALKEEDKKWNGKIEDDSEDDAAAQVLFCLYVVFPMSELCLLRSTMSFR